MSGRSFKVGQRVDVTGKDVKGVIAYVGMTSFAPGQWIGLVLDEAKGKNNGSIQGTSYFTVSYINLSSSPINYNYMCLCSARRTTACLSDQIKCFLWTRPGTQSTCPRLRKRSLGPG